ncbi:MAG: J domain-containing protein [Caldiserica bacterium]|nr:J domain-containing protein [Caldisericota bacterium]
MTPDKDLYGVLGVSPSASQEQIRSQYRVLVKKYHPDLHPGDASAALMMERVNAAYDIVGNSEERKQYDAEISASSQSRGETAAPTGHGQSVYGNPAAGARPRSTWNPQWGNTASDPREQQAEAEAMWEAMRSQERNRGGLFSDVWANVPDQRAQGDLSGWAVAGRVIWLIVRIVFGVLFIALRFLNTNVDDRNDFF